MGQDKIYMFLKKHRGKKYPSVILSKYFNCNNSAICSAIIKIKKHSNIYKDFRWEIIDQKGLGRKQYVWVKK